MRHIYSVNINVSRKVRFFIVSLAAEYIGFYKICSLKYSERFIKKWSIRFPINQTGPFFVHGVKLLFKVPTLIRNWFLGKRDTNLLCTNAVRKDKGTIYCSTHLIMNGLMEPRKKKAKAGAVIVESTELTSLSNNNLWNLSVIPRKANLTTALSQAVVGTEEEINCMCYFGYVIMMTFLSFLRFFSIMCIVTTLWWTFGDDFERAIP